jgi:hypothetical protein
MIQTIKAKDQAKVKLIHYRFFARRFERRLRRVRLHRARPLRVGRSPLPIARHHLRSEQVSWRQKEREQTGDAQWIKSYSQLHQIYPLQRRDRARNRYAHRRRHPRSAPINAAAAHAAAASPATSNAARSARDNRVTNASSALTFASASALPRIPPPNCPFASNCCCCCCFAICQNRMEMNPIEFEPSRNTFFAKFRRR